MGNVVITSFDPPSVWGDRKVNSGVLSLAASYLANGDSYTAGLFKMTRVERLILSIPDDGDKFYTVDYTNLKIKAFVANTGVEVAGTTDLSAIFCDFIAIGK